MHAQRQKDGVSELCGAHWMRGKACDCRQTLVGHEPFCRAEILLRLHQPAASTAAAPAPQLPGFCCRHKRLLLNNVSGSAAPGR